MSARLAMASGAGGAKQRLMAELQGLQKEKWVEIEVRWLRLLHSPPPSPW